MNSKNLMMYKWIAIIGIIIMGIGSFLSCLAPTKGMADFGTILLCLSIVISVIGFSKWQP